MPEPTPTPNLNAGANADATFLAHTQYQSDASLAAAYYAAHPDEAKAAGVNLPGQQAAPAPAVTPAPQSAPPPATQAPLFKAEGPEFYQQAFTHNQPYATPGPYQTPLNPAQEAQFQKWVGDKSVPFDPKAGTVDYDMRGFWKDNPDAAAAWQSGHHFPDTYKTPYDTTFSAESKYATPNNPLKWQGQNLVNTRTGQLVFGSGAAPTAGTTDATGGIMGGLLAGANAAPGLAKPPAPAWQQPPLPPGVPTAAQEALQQPAIDPTYVLGGGIAGGIEGGVMAGAKAAAKTALTFEVQDIASRVTGLATDNPYIKGTVGLVMPILLDFLAKRGISAASGAGAEPALPQGTVLDAQGRPVTSAPAAPEPVAAAAAPPVEQPAPAQAAPAAGGEPAPASAAAAQPTFAPGANPVATLLDGSEVELNRLGPGGPGYYTKDGSYLAADGTILDQTAVKSVAWPQGTLRGQAAATAATGAPGPSAPAAATPETSVGGSPGAVAAPPSPPPDDFSTPQGAAQTLAEKQLAALKTARVGENVAKEFGKPEIATRVPIEQTIAEGQALRHAVEMPAEPGAEQPELAAHTAAHAGVYQDESNAIRTEASRIRAAQEAGQDATADKEALANRFSAYAVNYANMAGMRSDVGRSLQILDPLKPENILATETAKLAQTVDPNDVDTLVDRLSKITYATSGDLADMRAEATRITAGEAAGQDMTAAKSALAERWKNSVTRTPAAVAEPEKPSGYAWTESPGGPLRPAGQWAKQWADKLAADTARLRGELNPDDVDTLVDKLSKLEPEQQAAMARQIGTAAQQGRSVSGMLREYFYNGLVSRPTTVVKKIASDITSWALNSPTRAIAAKIPVWWGGPKVAAGEGNAFAYGSVAAYQDGLRVAGNYFRAGSSAIDALGGGTGAEFEMPMAPEIRGSGQGGLMDTGADLMGHAVRMPTRTIGTAHEFARFVNFRGELHALALRQATHESGLQGLAGEKAGNFISQRATELADNPTPDLFQAAHTAANYNTFSQPLGPIGRLISKGLDKVPLGLGRFAFPFRKIPVNLSKWALNYTPIPAVAGAPGAALYGAARAAGADGTALGGSLNSFYTDMAAGGAPAQLALAKLGMGSAAMLAVHQAHLDGILTDGGPSDPKLYHDQLATGWKPYSLHVNGHYYGFQNLEPLGQYLGLGTDFSAIMGHMPEADVSHAAIAAAMAIGNNVSRQSYVEMLANFNRLVDGIKRGKGMSDALDEFGESELSGLIPAAIRAEARREDPVMRDTRGMFNTFLSKIPGYSKTMPPMTDALARPILAPAGFMENEVYPFPVSSDKHDPIADETSRLGASPENAPQLLPGSGTKAPSMMNPYSKENPNVGIPLTPWDQYNWKKLRASIKDDEGPDGKTLDGKAPTGNTLEQTLMGYLHNPEYQKAPREVQIKHWESAFQIYGHAATVQMNQRPDLKQKLDQRVRYKTEAATPPGVDQDTWLRQNGITPMAAGGDAPL